MFGVLSTATRPAKGYYQVVERRDRATLLPILAKCLQLRSEVFTDDGGGGAYQNLGCHFPNHDSLHQVVIDADNFVDPTSGKIITATFIVESLGFISFALTIAWL